MMRYCAWAETGYLSSTGTCFDIGNTTFSALRGFARQEILLPEQTIRTQPVMAALCGWRRFRCSSSQTWTQQNDMQRRVPASLTGQRSAWMPVVSWRGSYAGHYLANRRLRLPWGTGRHSWDRRRSLRWPVAPTLKSRKKIFAAPGMWWTVWKRRCGVSLVPALLRKQFLWRQIWATTQTQRLRYAGRWQERTMVRETSLLPGSNDLRCVRR
jgi:hypothetical protein